MKSKFSILVVLVLIFVILCCASCNRLIKDGTGDQYETHASQPTDSDDTTDTSQSTENTTSQSIESADPEESEIKEATNEAGAEEDAWVAENRVIPDVIPEFVQGDMKVYSAEDSLKITPYNFSFLPTYRNIYYWAPTFLFDLVDRDACRAWHEEVVKPNEVNNVEPQEMYIVSFVKHFKISREDFEAACEKKRLRFEEFHNVNGHDISDEAHEIPNADIIYTFDNEIINEYYRRDICVFTSLEQ